jgi:hypothetical protein
MNTNTQEATALAKIIRRNQKIIHLNAESASESPSPFRLEEHYLQGDADNMYKPFSFAKMESPDAIIRHQECRLNESMPDNFPYRIQLVLKSEKPDKKRYEPEKSVDANGKYHNFDYDRVTCHLVKK